MTLGLRVSYADNMPIILNEDFGGSSSTLLSSYAGKNVPSKYSPHMVCVASFHLQSSSNRVTPKNITSASFTSLLSSLLKSVTRAHPTVRVSIL